MAPGRTHQARQERCAPRAAGKGNWFGRRTGPRRPALRPRWANGALALLLLAARPAGAQGYTVTDLGTLGGTWSSARAINASGQVTGTSARPGDTVSHAFRWQNGVMTDLGTLGGSSSDAVEINDAGRVVGDSRIPGDTATHAFLWDGALHDLGTSGGTSSVARGINAAGQIVGYSFTPSAAPQYGFLYQNGGMQSLPGAQGNNNNIAFAINAAGQIVGKAAQPSGPLHAVRYDPAGIHDLGTLGGSNSEAYGINAGGQIIGYSYMSGDVNVDAFLFDNWGIHDLGTLNNTDFSVASGINSAGEIVGYSYYTTAFSTDHAFLSFNGVLTDLNTLLGAGSGWTLNQAFAINDYGQVVGVGTAPGGGTHAFLLTPPAPAAPSALTASVVSGTQVFLWWTDNSPEEAAFAVWRKTGAGSFARIAVVTPNTTGFLDSTVTAGTAYTYEVRAIGLGGASAWSNQVPVSPAAPSLAPPTFLSAAMATGAVSLAWTDNSSNETAFAIWRQGGGSSWARIGVVNPNTTAFSDANVSPSTLYSYRVRAISNSIASDWSNTVTLMTPAQPAAPTGLAAQVVSATQINLSWTDNSNLATGVAIWRQSGTGAWARIGVVPPSGTSYVDQSVSANTSYNYRVRAVNSYFASGWSNGVTPTTPP